MALTELDVGFEMPGPGPRPTIVAEASNLVSAVMVPLVAGLDSGATRKLVIRLWPDGHRASPPAGGTSFVLHEGVLLLETAAARFRLPSSEASFDEVALAVLDVVTVLLPEAAADQGWDVDAYRAAPESADRSVPLLVPWTGPWVSSRRGPRARAVGELGRTAGDGSRSPTPPAGSSIAPSRKLSSSRRSRSSVAATRSCPGSRRRSSSSARGAGADSRRTTSR